jgi:uncharacterized protein with PIN domain
VNFVVDSMLGKLTRWLRMMGHDAKYSTNLEDAELLAIAKEENRVLLTRDLELYQRAIAKGLDAYFVEGVNEAERLAELAHRFRIALEIDLEKSRCPHCNTKLYSATKEEIADKVEPNTLKYYDVFWSCPNCGSVYWQGAHWKKIRSVLEKAKEVL